MKHADNPYPLTVRPQAPGKGRQRLVIGIWAPLVLAWLLTVALTSYGQNSNPTEYEVKAAYLYNFARFVQWPESATPAKSGSFFICVIGQDPFGTALDTIIAGESIDGKSVVAKRVSKPEDAVNCRVLYISASEKSRLKEVLAALDKAGVLTVSDIPQFSQSGGMIQFVTAENRIRFEVNLTRTRDAGLILSSDLLKVAAAVRKTPRPGD